MKELKAKALKLADKIILKIKLLIVIIKHKLGL